MSGSGGTCDSTGRAVLFCFCLFFFLGGGGEYDPGLSRRHPRNVLIPRQTSKSFESPETCSLEGPRQGDAALVLKMGMIPRQSPCDLIKVIAQFSITKINLHDNGHFSKGGGAHWGLDIFSRKVKGPSISRPEAKGLAGLI